MITWHHLRDRHFEIDWGHIMSDITVVGLELMDAALQRIQQQGADAGIGTQVPDFVAGFFE